MKGSGTHDGNEIQIELTQTSKVYPLAERPERLRPTTPKEPKGKPKPPGISPDLEPIRQAMLGALPRSTTFQLW